MKFSDYDKKEPEKKASGSGFKTQQLLSLINKYEGSSEDEIIAAILETAKKSRKEGRLSDKEIDDFVGMLSPMLDSEKRKKLYEVVELIKSEIPE